MKIIKTIIFALAKHNMCFLNSPLAHPDSYREVRAKEEKFFIIMKPCVYIIYSKELDSFYIGETSNFENRLEEHKINFYENSFTSKAKDWILIFKIVCTSKKQAIKIEKHIKSMKSKTYIHNLKNYPEIAIKLKGKYLK